MPTTSFQYAKPKVYKSIQKPKVGCIEALGIDFALKCEPCGFVICKFSLFKNICKTHHSFIDLLKIDFHTTVLFAKFMTARIIEKMYRPEDKKEKSQKLPNFKIINCFIWWTQLKKKTFWICACLYYIFIFKAFWYKFINQDPQLDNDETINSSQEKLTADLLLSYDILCGSSNLP